MSKAIIAGVDMVKFTKPGQSDPFRIMASKAIEGAIADAGIDPKFIEQAYAGYVYGDSTCGQHALYDTMMAGIPVINVNNNCSTGSTALYLARQAVQSGVSQCVLAFGFEEMRPGALGSQWDDRESPFDTFDAVLDEKKYPQAPLALRCFGAAGHYYMEKYGASAELFSKVAVKTRNHAINNPYALLNTPMTAEDVSSSKTLYMNYLTRFMCCPPTCGAGAAIVCSDEFARKHGISHGVEIIAQAMTTDTPISWTDPINLVGADMTRRAAAQAYEQAGLGPEDIQVLELHDCFVTNEVVTYEGLGLCPEGEASKLVADADNTYGGQYVVNPSGGLMSKGHPLGATGLAQCFELCQQLRGSAGLRQVENAKVALQHNLGLGGAAVVTIYRMN